METKNENVIEIVVANIKTDIRNAFDADGELMRNEDGELIKSRRVTIEFEEAIKGVVRKDDDTFEVGDINSLTYNAYYLTDVVCAADEDIADDYISYQESTGEQSMPLSMIKAALKGATLLVDRTPYNEGDEYVTYDGEVRKHSGKGFDKAIVGVDLDDDAIDRFENRMFKEMKMHKMMK